MLNAFVVIILLSFSLAANAKVPAACKTAITDTEDGSKIELLKLVGRESVPALTDKIDEIKKQLGFGDIPIEMIQSCTNDNTDHLDFDSIRKKILSILTGDG